MWKIEGRREREKDISENSTNQGLCNVYVLSMDFFIAVLLFNFSVSLHFILYKQIEVYGVEKSFCLKES